MTRLRPWSPLCYLCQLWPAHIDHERYVKGSLAKPLLQHVSVQQLQNEERLSITGLADVIKGADVGMLERRDRARFAVESLARLGIGGVRRQDFDGHLSPETRVARPINLTHPPCPERADYLIWAEPIAG
jgi:hypothetical protein